MSLDLSNIMQVVQTNCHIADSQAAGDYTLCIYLLKMREFYRWESGYDYGDPLPGEEVGAWLRQREELWESLAENNFSSIPINGVDYDPFDSRSINSILKSQHLVYSGGLGRNTNAHFFLGVLERNESYNGFEIIVVADEYARDLTAPPAMSQGKTIYIRREAMRRLIWEKYEQWLWNRPNNAMARALSFYDFENQLEQSLTEMTDRELNSAILHEIGEVKAHEILGEQWEELLISLPHSKLELLLRSIRDHLADCHSTLPTIIEQENIASLHFYIANLSHLRKDLFPGLLSAYDEWLESSNFQALKKQVSTGAKHWEHVCQSALSNWQKNKDMDPLHLVDIIETSKL
ncbi:MAG: hypothetical protein PVG75_04940 [Thioalkalispiraceae bacterium]